MIMRLESSHSSMSHLGSTGKTGTTSLGLLWSVSISLMRRDQTFLSFVAANPFMLPDACSG